MSVATAPAILADREQALHAARNLLPSISARTSEAEENRQIPESTIAELLDAGLFGLVTPRRWGGSELGFETLLEVQAELATACTSTGWVFGVLAGHTWLASLFKEEAQAEIFADPRVLIASLVRLGGAPPERVDGGYRWRGGEGRFCSGIDHSNWVLAGGQVADQSGSGSERCYFLIPISDIDIVDDWYTVGLKGTGSKSIVVRDAFIPEHRVIRFSDLSAGTAPGSSSYDAASYHLPYESVWPLSLPGAAIGGAKAMIAEYTRAQAARLKSVDPADQAAASPALMRLAAAAAQVDSAFGLLLADARSIDQAHVGVPFNDLEKARRQRNLSYAVQQVRDAANTLFEASGGSGVYLTSVLQRWWRDVNVASSHVMFGWDIASVAYARLAIGIGNEGPGSARLAPGIPAGAKK